MSWSPYPIGNGEEGLDDAAAECVGWGVAWFVAEVQRAVLAILLTSPSKRPNA